MRLTVLDRPLSGLFAVDENGVVWRLTAEGLWSRGCLTGADALAGESLNPVRRRFVFLRPALAAGYPPLTLDDFSGAAK